MGESTTTKENSSSNNPPANVNSSAMAAAASSTDKDGIAAFIGYLLGGLHTPLSSLGFNGDSNIIDEFSVVIDKNLQAVRMGLYGIGILGGLIVLRSIRFGSNFTSVRKFPNSFMKKGVSLRGTVKSISTDGTLYIDHIPLMRMPWHSSSPENHLPLTLLGVKPTISGVYWMKLRLDDKPIWFKSLNRDSDSLHSIIYAKKSMISSDCINFKVLEEGLGHIKEPPSIPRLHRKTLKEYEEFFEKLRLAEDKAKKHYKGMYDTGLPPPTRLQTLYGSIKRIFGKLTRKKN